MTVPTLVLDRFVLPIRKIEVVARNSLLSWGWCISFELLGLDILATGTHDFILIFNMLYMRLSKIIQRLPLYHSVGTKLNAMVKLLAGDIYIAVTALIANKLLSPMQRAVLIFKGTGIKLDHVTGQIVMYHAFFCLCGTRVDMACSWHIQSTDRQFDRPV